MERKFKIQLIIWISVLLFSFGCSSKTTRNIESQPSQLVTSLKEKPTQTSTIVPSLTPTPMLTPTMPAWVVHLTQTKTPTVYWKTWAPTQEPDQSDIQELVDIYLSQEMTCKIPCWLGITNGFTWYESALSILKSKFPTDLYTIAYPDGIKKIRLTLPASGINGSSWTEATFIFLRNKNAQTTVSLPEIKNFQLYNFLINYGQPDRILIDGAFGVWEGSNYFNIMMIYDQKGIYIDYSGEGKEIGESVRLCPQSLFGNHLILWDPTEDITFEEAVTINPDFTYPSHFNRSIEKVTDATVDTFTKKMIDIPSVGCFEISKEKWDNIN